MTRFAMPALLLVALASPAVAQDAPVMGAHPAQVLASLAAGAATTNDQPLDVRRSAGMPAMHPAMVAHARALGHEPVVSQAQPQQLAAIVTK
ncbi:MAG TPA: hypothetical protein VFQ57_05910 [Sphingomonas sp.]|jgi:hypothetical protein|nr:hypothetical protein [Sphingomonas sp.]